MGISRYWAPLLWLLLCVGCVVGATPRPKQAESASGPPPPPSPNQDAARLLTRPAPAASSAVAASGPVPVGRVWVAGYWHYNGVDYEWVPGRWETRPAHRSP